MGRQDEITPEDIEQLERYREWKRSQARNRAVRRWRWIRGVSMVVVLGLIVGALVTWMAALRQRERVASEPLAAPLEREAAHPNPSDGTVVATPPTITPEPAAGRTPVAPRRASRVPSAAPWPAASNNRASSSEVVAAVRPSPPLPTSLDAPAATAPPITSVDTPSTASTASPAVVSTSPTVTLEPAETASRPSDTTTGGVPAAPRSPPSEPNAVTANPPSSPPELAPRAGCEQANECAKGWLKGEVQEFRDGVKREIGEFRAGFVKVRQGLQRLGSKLRGAK